MILYHDKNGLQFSKVLKYIPNLRNWVVPSSHMLKISLVLKDLVKWETDLEKERDRM